MAECGHWEEGSEPTCRPSVEDTWDDGEPSPASLTSPLVRHRMEWLSCDRTNGEGEETYHPNSPPATIARREKKKKRGSEEGPGTPGICASSAARAIQLLPRRKGATASNAPPTMYARGARVSGMEIERVLARGRWALMTNSLSLASMLAHPLQVFFDLTCRKRVRQRALPQSSASCLWMSPREGESPYPYSSALASFAPFSLSPWLGTSGCGPVYTASPVLVGAVDGGASLGVPSVTSPADGRTQESGDCPRSRRAEAGSWRGWEGRGSSACNPHGAAAVSPRKQSREGGRLRRASSRARRQRYGGDEEAAVLWGVVCRDVPAHLAGVCVTLSRTQHAGPRRGSGASSLDSGTYSIEGWWNRTRGEAQGRVRVRACSGRQPRRRAREGFDLPLFRRTPTADDGQRWCVRSLAAHKQSREGGAPVKGFVPRPWAMATSPGSGDFLRSAGVGARAIHGGAGIDSGDAGARCSACRILHGFFGTDTAVHVDLVSVPGMCFGRAAS
ncbi:hypothetical protein B0H19DRAFT_1082379 [Mycena capillaripes]|nr:hypothetical protein B0H19DRAFT_1082379 [Mycena capillaripes]